MAGCLRACIAAFSLSALALASPAWRLTRNADFEIYTQTADPQALATLTWLEQLRTFFDLNQSEKRPVRVIIFASEQEYQPYRLRSAADAYFVGNGNQEYIVLGVGNPAKLGLAAHEYAHLVLRARGNQFPPWLAEGLADFLSTLRVSGHSTELGGVLTGRVRILQTRSWMPLEDLLAVSPEAKERQDRSTAGLFYAESWALTEMLLLSPKYGPAFQKTFAFPTDDIVAVNRDLHQWVKQSRLPVIQLPEVVTPPVQADISDVSEIDARLMLAQLLLAAGEFQRAEQSFQSLAKDAPQSAEVYAGLGAVSLHQGDAERARRSWKQAMDRGIRDPGLCYNYAVLADQAGLPAIEIRAALERAIALRPDFDDAHYQLALLEKNAGHYDAALREFRAMRDVPAKRSYAYWLALADTFNELGQREEAQTAARRAAEFATTPAERARAGQQRYIAETDSSVQFTRDPSGELRLVTTRVPHQQTERNPFIEATDDMHRVQGRLMDINCGDVTTIRVESAGRALTLSIPDLKHVEMSHAPAEFVCGAQEPAQVTVDYARTPQAAVEGVVRGMKFESVH